MDIPIFPLPNVVFFPHTFLPLHVFEPRYRQMLADCLAGGRRLAVVLLKPGWEPDYYGRPPVYAVAGAGEIVEAESLPDGRSNILLRGLGRIRIEREVASPAPYRIARASWIADVYPSGGEGDLAPVVDRLRRLCGELLSQLPEPPPGMLEVMTRRDVAGAFVDRVSHLLVHDTVERERLLELEDVERRLATVVAVVEVMLGQIKRGRAPVRARWN
jgi:uncharacterized protein